MVRARQESMVKSVERKLTSRKKVNKGAWTAEEDRKLAEALAIHGATKWQRIACKSELNRSGKSCRLRWLNYLRPNIKRGNISDQEEDLILRLHKLIGNRWSLIAGRLPGRTDNEIKNYWNSHLSKKVKQITMNQISGVVSITRDQDTSKAAQGIIHMKVVKEDDNLVKTSAADQDSNNSSCFDMDDFFDFSNEGPFNLEWITNFV